MNSLIKFALYLANMPDKEISDLELSLPGMARLAEAAKQLEPILTKAEPLVAQLQPLAAQAWPIVQKAWPDIIAVTPTAQELIQFASQKGI